MAHVRPRRMTIGKLIKHLNQFPSDRVVFTSDYEMGPLEACSVRELEWNGETVVIIE